MNTFTFDCCGVPVGADLYPAIGPAKAAILYFHGGGLLYGRRDDLPQPYIQAITGRGYHLICLDYLLAPESPLPQIHACADRALEWFLAAREGELGLGHCPFVLFGRSAGAYLALLLAHRLGLAGGEQPLALWAFYGYHDLRHPFFTSPSPHYQMLPQIDRSLIPDLWNAPPVSSAPIESRFFLYVYARQQGAWPRFLTRDVEDWGRFSISDDGLRRLPPTFLTASTADQDVPFSFSRKMSLFIPDNQFLPVYGLEHDYDRDPALAESQALYRECLDWLDRKVTP
ncbi:alpha/beta hydrolase [Flavonifractor hominis]|uniref:Alpha/beta hydrolase n=1 Tax=Flavonifractor hominis TaxID=3133178 RepID=A0ABV1ENN2_9FIRM